MHLVVFSSSSFSSSSLLSSPLLSPLFLSSPLPFLRSQRSESARWCLCQRAATARLHPAEDRRASAQRGPAVRHFPNSAGDPPGVPHSPPLRPSTFKALSSFLTVNAANYGPPPSPPHPSPHATPLSSRFPLSFHHPSLSLSTWVSHITHLLKKRVCELKEKKTFSFHLVKKHLRF